MTLTNFFVCLLLEIRMLVTLSFSLSAVRFLYISIHSVRYNNAFLLNQRQRRKFMKWIPQNEIKAFYVVPSFAEKKGNIFISRLCTQDIFIDWL